MLLIFLHLIWNFLKSIRFAISTFSNLLIFSRSSDLFKFFCYMFCKYKNAHHMIQQISKNLGQIKGTATNYTNIVWAFLYTSFKKNYFVAKTLFFMFFWCKYLCRFPTLIWVPVSERWQHFREGCCILSQCLEFLYFGKPIFEFDSSNCCLVFLLLPHDSQTCWNVPLSAHFV